MSLCVDIRRPTAPIASRAVLPPPPPPPVPAATFGKPQGHRAETGAGSSPISPARRGRNVHHGVDEPEEELYLLSSPIGDRLAPTGSRAVASISPARQKTARASTGSSRTVLMSPPKSSHAVGTVPRGAPTTTSSEAAHPIRSQRSEAYDVTQHQLRQQRPTAATDVGNIGAVAHLSSSSSSEPFSKMNLASAYAGRSLAFAPPPPARDPTCYSQRDGGDDRAKGARGGDHFAAAATGSIREKERAVSQRLFYQDVANRSSVMATAAMKETPPSTTSLSRPSSPAASVRKLNLLATGHRSHTPPPKQSSPGTSRRSGVSMPDSQRPGSSIHHSSTVDALLEWDAQRRMRIQSRETVQREIEASQFTGRPNISDVSREIVTLVRQSKQVAVIAGVPDDYLTAAGRRKRREDRDAGAASPSSGIRLTREQQQLVTSRLHDDDLAVRRLEAKLRDVQNQKDIRQCFRPKLSPATYALCGGSESLPVQLPARGGGEEGGAGLVGFTRSVPVHERLMLEGKYQAQRRQERQLEAEREAKEIADVGARIGPVSRLFCDMRQQRTVSTDQHHTAVLEDLQASGTNDGATAGIRCADDQVGDAPACPPGLGIQEYHESSWRPTSPPKRSSTGCGRLSGEKRSRASGHIGGSTTTLQKSEGGVVRPVDTSVASNESSRRSPPHLRRDQRMSSSSSSAPKLLTALTSAHRPSDSEHHPTSSPRRAADDVSRVSTTDVVTLRGDNAPAIDHYSRKLDVSRNGGKDIKGLARIALMQRKHNAILDANEATRQKEQLHAQREVERLQKEGKELLAQQRRIYEQTRHREGRANGSNDVSTPPDAENIYDRQMRWAEVAQQRRDRLLVQAALEEERRLKEDCTFAPVINGTKHSGGGGSSSAKSTSIVDATQRHLDMIQAKW